MSNPPGDQRLQRLGSELKRLRTAAGLNQQTVATAAGVQRATVAQWEGGRHAPAEDKLRLLDGYFKTGGALVALAGADAPLAVGPSASLAAVYRRLGDRLVRGMLTDPDDERSVGWAQHIGRGTRPTPWSTAIGMRILLLLDRADVDLARLADTLGRRQHNGGWSNRALEVPVPDVTAVVLATLSRVGSGGADLDRAWAWLDTAAETADQLPTFMVSTALEHLAPLRPDSTVVASLVRRLLDARIDFDGPRMWVADPSADPDRMQPSVAHTAHAIVALGAAAGHAEHSEVEDTIGEAISWLAAQRNDDGGITEVLRIDPDDRTLDVPVDHFTSAYVVRALAGVDGLPPGRLESALQTLWEAYVPADGLWAWRLSGRLPVWMNYDAVVALTAAALAHYPAPHDIDRRSR